MERIQHRVIKDVFDLWKPQRQLVRGTVRRGAPYEGGAGCHQISLVLTFDLCRKPSRLGRLLVGAWDFVWCFGPSNRDSSVLGKIQSIESKDWERYRS